MSTVKVVNLQHPDAASPAVSLDSSGAVSSLAGFTSAGLLQVVHTKFDTPTLINANQNSYVDVPNFTGSITPSSASSKILIFLSVSFGAHITGGYMISFAVKKNGSIVSPPSSFGQRVPAHIATEVSDSNNWQYNVQHASALIMDTPNSTSQQTYQVAATHNVSGEAWNLYVNRSNFDYDDPQNARAVSTLTLAELAV